MAACAQMRGFRGAAALRPRPAQRTMAWRSLPNEQQLEVCKYLDAFELGRLECSGRDTLGGSPERAYSQAVEGVSRGVLASLSSKRFAVAHARTRALIPTSRHQARGIAKEQRENVFEGLAFSVLIQWQDEHGEFQTVVFDYMSSEGLPDDHVFADFPKHGMLKVSDDAPGHDLLTPILLRSQSMSEGVNSHDFAKSWNPTASIFVTRIRDGAAIKLAHFDGVDYDINSLTGLDRGKPKGSVSFCIGSLVLDKGYIDIDVHLDLLSVHGKLSCISTSYYLEDAADVPDHIIEGLIYAKFEMLEIGGPSHGLRYGLPPFTMYRT